MIAGARLAFAAGWLLRASAASLGLAAAGRLREALEAGFDPRQLAWLLPLALGLGWLKARRAMGPVLSRNRARLLAAGATAPWRVFPPALLAMIAAMIGSVALLAAWVGATAWGAAALGAVDLAVGCALLLAAPAQGPAWGVAAGMDRR